MFFREIPATVVITSPRKIAWWFDWDIETVNRILGFLTGRDKNLEYGQIKGSNECLIANFGDRKRRTGIV